MRVSVIACGVLILLLFMSSTAFADPTIEVWDPGMNYTCSGWGYIMYSVPVNSSGTPEQFTIGNHYSSTINLNLTGNPYTVAKSGANPSNFTIVQPGSTSLAPAATTTFTVAFSASAIGSYSADLTIISNDTANPSYVISVACEAIADCEINVKQGATNLPCGSGVYDFGNVIVGQSSAVTTFTIENTGTTSLHLTINGLGHLVGIEGSPSFFTVDDTMTSGTILASSYTTFTIVFNPNEEIYFTAVVSIDSDDTDEDPYEFFLLGNGIKPKFDFNGDGYHDAIVGAPYDDDGGSDSGCAYIFYGSSNPSATIDAATANVKLVGASSYDNFGMSVSDAGDVNGDGYSDVIVGAPSADGGSASSGCAYIFYGSSNPSATINASAANIKLLGENISDSFGCSVSSAGDINDDDYSDIIVGAALADDNGGASGNAYVFYGRSSASWSAATPINASNASVKIIGESTGDNFGLSVSNGGKLNEDDFDDFIVGAPNSGSSGCAYIFFGSSSLSSTIYASNAGVIISGDSSNDYFGWSVSNAGDVNWDGFDDVIIGAFGDDDGGAFIFYGRDSAGWSSIASCYAANANVKFVCNNAADGFGYSVSYVGDVNNDGYDDVIVGAPFDSDGGSSSGCAFIFYGSGGLSSTVYASNANIKIVGNSAYDYLGTSVGFVGDFNGDGIDDVIVGANQDDNGGADSGCAFVFYGRTTASWSAATPINASNASVTLVGADAGDYFGNSVGGGR